MWRQKKVLFIFYHSSQNKWYRETAKECSSKIKEIIASRKFKKYFSRTKSFENTRVSSNKIMPPQQVIKSCSYPLILEWHGGQRDKIDLQFMLTEGGSVGCIYPLSKIATVKYVGQLSQENQDYLCK